jgi:hypothetical protein
LDRKGSTQGLLTKLPKNEKRVMAIASAVFFVCYAVFEILLAWSRFPYYRASVWLVISADSLRRYMELKSPEISSSQ